MKDFVQASKKISFLYHGIILASLVGEVVMLGSWKESCPFSIQVLLISFTPSLPHHFICDCKEKLSLGLFGHVRLFLMFNLFV